MSNYSTVEEVDDELDSIETTTEANAGLEEDAGDSSSSAQAQAKLFNICGVYAKARPVLRFARGLLFWKPKWQAILDTAMAALDESCDIK